MNRKRVVARLLATILVALFAAGISVDAYFNEGGWPAVAAMWGSIAVLAGMCWAFVWAVDNWNAS